MSQYNKTVLTNAGLELAKRANAGQAKFEITRAVTSADDWSNKTIQDLEEVTAIPNIMQQGTIMDTEEVESNNSVIGVSLCFANKDLSTGYQIRIIGVYVKEEGQENDFLYAVTTAVSPEYMPDFNDKVLYRFNMQMYLVIGKAQAVNVVINDGASVTHGQFDKYKGEVAANLEKIANTHKEDMSHVVKSASINGGDEILPDEAGKLELVVPDPDLSKYVSLEQLTETLKTKADITAIPDKTATEEGIKQAKELAQEANTKAQNAMESKADKTNVYTKLEVDGKTSGTIITGYDVASKTAAKETNAYSNRELVDQAVLGQVADAINAVNGTNRIANAVDVNTLTGEASKVHVYVLPNSGNTNTPSWVSDKRGNLIVINYDGNAKTQLWFPVGSGNNQSIGVRYWEGNNYPAWNRIAIQSDIDSLLAKITNATNAASNKVDTVLTNSYFRKQGMDQNGNAVEIRANAVKQTDGGYAFDIWNTDWTASKLKGVLDQLPSKANSADVYTKTEVDSKTSGTIITYYDIVSKTPTKETNSYTNKWLVDQNVLGQFADAINSINLTRVPLVNGSGDDDLLAFKTNQIRLYPGNGKTCKNLPPASNTQWFTVQYVFENPNGDGIAIFRSPANEVWTIGNNGGIYTTGWVKLANSNDISDLQNQIQQLRESQFEVQTFTDANAAANWESQRPGKRMAIVNK